MELSEVDLGQKYAGSTILGARKDRGIFVALWNL